MVFQVKSRNIFSSFSAMLLWYCIFVAQIVYSQSSIIEKKNIDEFIDSVSVDQRPILTLFTDFECGESEAGCEQMRESFEGVARLFKQRYLDHPTEQTEQVIVKANQVRFIHVLDHFGSIMNRTKLDYLPRIVFYEKSMPVPIRYFSSARKQKDEALLQFLIRMLQPQVQVIESEDQLASFLFPPINDVRDVFEEDPVSFILIEPEFGSLRSRSRYAETAKKYRARRFFGHIRGSGLLKHLNLSSVEPPALVRTETGRKPRVLLNGYKEFFNEGALDTAVARFQFPLLQHLQGNNVKEVLENEAGAIVVLGLYSTENERKKRWDELEMVAKDFQDSFIYATLSKNEFNDFLKAFLDDEVQDEFLALHRANGTFYLQERRQPLIRFLENILTGKQKVLHERGSKALPRLIRKAFASRPIMAVLGFGGSLVFGLLILWYCSCGLRRTILGLDEYNYFPKRNLHQGSSSLSVGEQQHEPTEQVREPITNDKGETQNANQKEEEAVLLEEKTPREQEELRTRARGKKNKNKSKLDTQKSIVESTDFVAHDKQE